MRSIQRVFEGQSFGDSQCKIAQRSTTSFAIGVPVKANRMLASPVAAHRARVCLLLGSLER